jgi:hypothetical protein
MKNVPNIPNTRLDFLNLGVVMAKFCFERLPKCPHRSIASHTPGESPAINEQTLRSLLETSQRIIAGV